MNWNSWAIILSNICSICNQNFSMHNKKNPKSVSIYVSLIVFLHSTFVTHSFSSFFCFSIHSIRSSFCSPILFWMRLRHVSAKDLCSCFHNDFVHFCSYSMSRMYCSVSNFVSGTWDSLQIWESKRNWEIIQQTIWI